MYFSRMSLKTGFFFNDSSLLHELEPDHPESAERLRAILRRLESPKGITFFMPFSPQFDKDVHTPLISAVHTMEHIREVLSIPGTGRAAGDSVAAVIAAVDAVYEGKIANAFCAVRPPGHHAHNDAHRDGFNKGEGFCFFNNVAIAARHAQCRHGAGRVLIIDWDFHHGNGTESFFSCDPSVFYCSIHRFDTYPFTGSPEKTGIGKGAGFTFNCPLPRPGSPPGPVDDSEFLAALSLITDRLDAARFSPDIVLISAGFDGLRGDPLGTFSLSEHVFFRATEVVMGIADRHCSGRIVSVLEGGYHTQSLAAAVEEHMRALSRCPGNRGGSLQGGRP